MCWAWTAGAGAKKRSVFFFWFRFGRMLLLAFASRGASDCRVIGVWLLRFLAAMTCGAVVELATRFASSRGNGMCRRPILERPARITD